MGRPPARPPSGRWRPHSSGVTLTVQAATERLVEHIGAVVVGKREVTEQLFGALLVEGHVLLDDVPGVGKTTLARAVARYAPRSHLQPLQCTPDSCERRDRVSIYDQHAAAFEYGPARLANVVLVDEINRATRGRSRRSSKRCSERQLTATRPRIPCRSVPRLATQNRSSSRAHSRCRRRQTSTPLSPEPRLPDCEDEDRILRIHGPAKSGPRRSSRS